MAPQTNISDKIGWSGLSTAASDGQLSLEPGIAQTSAQHVEAMLNSIVGVNSWIYTNFQQASPTIAATQSGTDLAGAFELKIAIEMEVRMLQHQTVLTDMGNTFVAAGQAYEGSETDSTVSFDSISFDDPSGTSPSGAPVVQALLPDQPPPNYPDTVMEKVDVTPEEGSNFSWQQLYAIGQSIDPQAVANAAGVWYWLAIDLADNFATLRSNIDAVANQWTGTGATRAISATQRYTTASQQFTSDMNKIGDVLLYTSHWLQQTKNSMPTTPNPPTTSGSGYQTTAADIAQLTAPYQSAFTTNYTDSFGDSSNNLVVLPEPLQVTRPPTTDGGSNNGNSTTGSGSGQTTGTTTTSPPIIITTTSPPTITTTSSSPNDTSPITTTITSPSVTSPITTTTSPSVTSPITTTTSSSDTSPITTTTTSPTTTTTSPITTTTTSPTTTTTTTSPTTTSPTTTTTTSSAIPSIPSIPLTTNSLGNSSSGLPTSAKAASAGNQASELTNAEKGMVSRLGGGLGGGRPLTAAEQPQQGSKLFPRSSLSGPGPEGAGRAGPAEERAPGYPMGGSPGAKKDQEKQRKHSDLLNSTEHLDEAIGELDRSVRPVLDR